MTDSKCVSCQHYHTIDDEYAWCHECAMNNDHYKPMDELEKQETHNINIGKWTTHRTQEHDGEWYCSKCGYEPVVLSDDMKYCPGCGRKMLLPEPPKEE